MRNLFHRRTRGKFLLTVATLLVMALLAWSRPTLAATGTNKEINFQGKVVNTDGTNVPDGNYNFVFSIYTAPSGGTPIWTETWNSGTSQIAVKAGVFSVSLGTYTSLPGSIDFNTDNIYLGMDFNGDGEMSPRIQFTAVPQAFNAQKVAGLTVTDTTGTLTILNGKTVSFGDAFTTSGANPLTLTTTGTTNATLPVGTVTLADLNSSQTFTNKTLTNPLISTVYGGSGASSTLSLNGTSSGSPSNAYVLLNSAGQGNVGIGTATPGQLLDVRGRAAIGNQTATGVSSGANTLLVSEQTTDGTQNAYGIQDLLQVNTASDTSKNYYGIFGDAATYANANNYTGRLVGLQGQADHNGSGTVTQARGAAGFVDNNASGSITSAYGGKFAVTNNSNGTVGSAYGLYVNGLVNTGTVTNNYGLYLEAQTAGATNYSIYSAGGTNYFAGNVGIGVSSSLGAQLHVLSTTEQLRLAYDATHYTSFTTSSAGNLTIAPSGGTTSVTGALKVSGTTTLNTGLSGILMASSGVVSQATAGTDYMLPVTFSTGFTVTDNDYTVDLSTGVASGQSVIGGTGSGENLTLQSTANATKGSILFGTSSYDQANNRLKINTSSSVVTADGVNNATLHVVSGDPFLGSFEGSGAYAGFDVNGTGGSSVPYIQLNRGTNRILSITAGTDNDTISFRGGNAAASSILTLTKSTSAASFAGTLGVTTSLTSPIVYGGSNAGSTLALNGTSNGSPSNAYVLLNSAGQGNVGIGTATPTGALNVIKTTEQLRLGYDTSNYASFATSSSGNLTVTPSGGATSLASSTLAVTPAAVTSGTAPKALTVTAAAHTGLTASGEITDILFDLSRTTAQAAGTVANQRSVQILGPTLSYASATTVTSASTLYVTPPAAGTNASFNHSGAIEVASGGSIIFDSNTYWGSVSESNGALVLTHAYNGNLNITASGGSWQPAASGTEVSITAATALSTAAMNLIQYGQLAQFKPTSGAITFTGSWTGMSLANTFGNGANTTYNGTAPLTQLLVAPTINVNTASTTGYTALLVNATETSLSATATDYLADLQVGGSSKFSVTDAGNIWATSGNISGVTTASALSLSANSLTTGTGFYAASSSLTSGYLANLQVSGTAAASNTQTALNVLTAGANATDAQTTYGLQVSNTHTTSASTNTNIAGYFSATGGTNNYGLIVANGNAGIGQTSPTAKLQVTPTGTNDGIQIDRLGTGSTAATYWKLGVRNAGDTDSLVLGQSSSAYATGGALGWLGNSEAFLYYPTTFKIGTGTGSGTATTFTSGGSVGIGTGTTVSAKLHVLSTTEQLRLGYDASNYLSVTVNSTGSATFAPTGTNAGFTFNPQGTGAVAINSGATTSSSLSVTANSLTSGQALYLNSTSLSSGSMLYINVNSTAAASNTQRGINISLQGANATGSQTTAGMNISNAHTGSGTNVGLSISSSGGANNYALVSDLGYFGIGTLTPDTLLHVKGVGAKEKIETTGAGGINEVLQLVDTGNPLLDRGVKLGMYVPSGSNSNRLGAEISAANDATLTGTYLTLNTEQASVVSEKVRVTGSGSVGIGTSTPQAKLAIASGSAMGIELPTPAAPTVTPATSGGSMADGTYYYVIVARDASGTATSKGTESAAATISGGSGSGSVALSWAAVTGAKDYSIYRTTTSGTYTTPALITSSLTTTSFTDTLASPTSGAPSATNGAFAVKINSAGASWLSGGGLTIGTTSSNSKLTIQATSAMDQPTYSGEFLGSSGWTSADWTGSFASGWKHTVGTVESTSKAGGGSGYAVNDVLTLVGGNNDATLTVNTVDGSGAILTYTVTTKGSGYSVASGLSVTGGTGSAATFNVLTVNNTTTLSQSTAAVASTRYQITWTVTGRTAGTFKFTFGGLTSDTQSASGAWAPTTTSTANFTVLPSATFDGTVTFSIKSLTAASLAVATYYTSSSTVQVETRVNSSSYNNFYGYQAGQYNTTGQYNHAFGYQALANNTTGGRNIAMGFEALYQNTVGGNNVAVGYEALQNNWYGSANTALGYSTLASNTTGGTNVAVGYSALSANTTGGSNLAIGYAALSSNTTSSNITAVGTQALQVTTGANNTALGAYALVSMTSGADNTALGYQAGRFLADGSTANVTSGTSLYLGENTKAGADGNTNEIVVGYNAIGNGTNTATLGNTSITNTYLQGTVKVGSATQVQLSGTQIYLTNVTTGSNTSSPAIKLEGNGYTAGPTNTTGSISLQYQPTDATHAKLMFTNAGIGTNQTIASLAQDGTWTARVSNTTGTPDYAEYIQTTSEVSAGDVVVATTGGTGKESFQATDNTVRGNPSILGAISDGTSGFSIDAYGQFTGALANQGSLQGKPLTLAGRIPVKVTTRNGAAPVHQGDLLMASDKAGYAEKYDPTAGPVVGIIGVALNDLLGGDGLVTTQVQVSRVVSPTAALTATLPTLSVQNLTVQNLTATGDITLQNLSVVTDTLLQGALNVSKDATFQGSVTIGVTGTNTATLVVNGTTSLEGDVSFGKRVSYDSNDRQTVVNGSTIQPTSSFIIVKAATQVTLSQTRAVADGTTGQVLILSGSSDSKGAIVFHNANTKLGATTRLLGPNDVLKLIWNGSDWIEESFTHNLQ